MPGGAARRGPIDGSGDEVTDLACRRLASEQPASGRIASGRIVSGRIVSGRIVSGRIVAATALVLTNQVFDSQPAFDHVALTSGRFGSVDRDRRVTDDGEPRRLDRSASGDRPPDAP